MGITVLVVLQRKLSHGIRPVQVERMEELTVIAIIDGTRSLEHLLHGLLKEHRLRGEWFRDCDDVRCVIAEAVAGKHVVKVPEPIQDIPPEKPAISPEFEILCRLFDETEAALERGDDKYEIRGRVRAVLAASEVFMRQRGVGSWLESEGGK